jgi:hypothetical protein
MAEAGEVKDFTNEDKKPDIEFRVDDDLFRAVGDPPAMAILDVSAVNKADGMDKVRVVLEFLDQVLRDESAELFAERMRSKVKPIGIDQATGIAVWLMEEKYAPDRPTEAPSPSQNGSGSTGPSSTDGAQAGGSTPEPSSRRVL